uniref:Ribonuclease P protein subunit p29 n=1 Tax=Fundulus heteroclitus TaxID=8078 RepID=A0A3Q2PEL9_FUNHE
HVVQKLIESMPGRIAEVLKKRAQHSTKFTEAYLKNCIQQPTRLDVKNIVTHKAVILGYSRPKKDKTKRNSKKAKGLSARQKRTMKVFRIKPEHQRYELFLPLHKLWGQYIIDLCGGLKPTSLCGETLILQLITCVLIVTVVRSKCPSYVGTTGILIQEFKHVFKIITKEDKVKVIPKKNSVFSVEIEGFVSHIYGNKFELRSSERSAKKFKVKGTIDL